MAVPNLIALAALSPVVFKLTRERLQSLEPVAVTSKQG
jgi:Na+/alanine symporter